MNYGFDVVVGTETWSAPTWDVWEALSVSLTRTAVFRSCTISQYFGQAMTVGVTGSLLRAVHHVRALGRGGASALTPSQPLP